MRILVSVVNFREPKALTGSFCSGYGGSEILRHEQSFKLLAHRDHLNYRNVIPAEQGKLASFLVRGRKP